ncbi:MAG: glycosyltransferase, partial [Bacilli bacterium]|nr:glycosyltransferase [Bacilli bacterium]
GALEYVYEGSHDVNVMKGAMLMADAVSTVSPTYANDLHSPYFGIGLQGVVDMVQGKLYGILNGINMDHYDPRKDKRIPAKFSRANLEGKDECKAYLQEAFGLRKEKEWPLFCSVARLVEQKGIELIKEIIPRLMKMGVQIIVYGQGEQHYIDYFTELTRKYPGQFGFSSDYNEEMAAKVFAGSDFYLMPSSFEPCGLSQMMAMRYGTIPIVHETGGLKDSVRPYSDFDGLGDGFSFTQYNGMALYLAILQPVKLHFGTPEAFAKLRDRCLRKDFAWNKSALVYEKMYSDICGSGNDPSLSFLDAYEELKEAYEALEDHRNAYLALQEDDYENSVQVRIEGAGSGTFSLKFDKKNGLQMFPFSNDSADNTVAASFDNLIGMAKGEVSADHLFVTGQMKVEGNISKGAQLRYLIGKKTF